MQPGWGGTKLEKDTLGFFLSFNNWFVCLFDKLKCLGR